MTSMRPIGLRSAVAATTSAVPAQLLPTIRTSRSATADEADEAGATAAIMPATSAETRKVLRRNLIGTSEQGVTVR
jgi:hypothetical protein